MRLRFASDRIFGAATSIGKFITLEIVRTFEIVSYLLKKGGVLNSPENLQFWLIAQSLFIPVFRLYTHYSTFPTTVSVGGVLNMLLNYCPWQIFDAFKSCIRKIGKLFLIASSPVHTRLQI